MDHGGLERCWQQHVPEGLDADTPVPLLVDMHGYSSDSTNHKKLSSFDKIADDHGAIVVYPDGVLGRNLPTDLEENQAWNAGWCCAHSAKDRVDDVGFIERVVNFTLDMHNVDSDRIYASGWSNGCAMAQRLAMELSHTFAAVGCMAFYLLTDPIERYSPIPIMEVHGFWIKLFCTNRVSSVSHSAKTCGQNRKPTRLVLSRTCSNGPCTMTARGVPRPSN